MQLLREKALKGEINHFRNVLLCPMGELFYPGQVLIRSAGNNCDKFLFKADVLNYFVI